jgi:hypothetical protein
VLYGVFLLALLGKFQHLSHMERRNADGDGICRGLGQIANLPSSDSVSVFFLSPPRRQREGVGGLVRDDWLDGEGQGYYVDCT